MVQTAGAQRDVLRDEGSFTSDTCGWWCQGSKSHNGPGAAKHSGRARPSARSGNDGAAEQEEPRLNGHKTPQANGWQRGFLNRTSSSNGDEADGSGAAARFAVPKHSQAHSSGDSSSEQWEPDRPSAADQVLPSSR